MGIRKVAPEVGDEWARLYYDEGLLQRQIAQQYGVDASLVSQYLRRRPDWKAQRNDLLTTAERKQSAVELYRTGLNVSQVARQLTAGNDWVKRALREAGIPIRPPAGEHHPMWDGGRIKNGGYILVYRPDHPHCSQAGYVREHRLVMEGILGRFLDPEEVVHHKNCDKSDNRPENLEVFPNQAAHVRHELTGRKRGIVQSEDGLRRMREALARSRAERQRKKQ